MYSRVMEVAGEIGGVRGVRARLQVPLCVKWAPHGELVILDTQVRRPFHCFNRFVRQLTRAVTRRS